MDQILYSGQGTKLVFFHSFCSLPPLATWVKHNKIKEKKPPLPLWSQKNWIHERQKLLFSATELAFWRTTRYEKTCTSSSAGGWRNASLTIPARSWHDATGLDCGTDRHSAVSRLHPRPAVSIDVVGHTRSGSGRVWDEGQRGGWVERWHHTCVPRYTDPTIIRCNDIANSEQKLLKVFAWIKSVYHHARITEQYYTI